MRNFDASRSDGAPLNCYQCGKLIVENKWFARINFRGGHVALCRPGCVELFLDRPAHCVGAEGQRLPVSAFAADPNFNRAASAACD